MTEKRFLLTEQFVTLSGITFIKDDDAEVDMYYTVDGAVDLLNDYAEENEELKQSNKDAWNLIRFIYNEIKEDGYMDWGRIQDLVEF